MDFNEFNRRALSALNHYPKKDRLLLLRKVVAYTKRYGYKASADQVLPALEKGGLGRGVINAKTLEKGDQKCQDAGASTPGFGHTATLF